MEAIIPADVLLNIFTQYLGAEALEAVYKTCTYWRDIIDHYKLWKKKWARLRDKAQNSCLKRQINRIHPIDLKTSCVRLEQILSNKYTNSCDCNSDVKKVSDVVLLKTHHSHFLLTRFKVQDNMIYEGLEFCKQVNKQERSHIQYVQFRSPQKIVNSLTEENCLCHAHSIKQLYYIYPMGLSDSTMSQIMVPYFFRAYHTQEIVFIPRVLMLCENLNVSNGVVIYSSSQTTEIAVVLNGRVVEGRWCELPIGGWNVSRYLYDAVQWNLPKICNGACDLEKSKFKKLCWIKHVIDQCNFCREFQRLIRNPHGILKQEQYLAPELMYTELDLCSVFKRLLAGLEGDSVADCLSHIFLTGGNCKLQHLKSRLKSDLSKVFPRYRNSIEISYHCAQDFIYDLTPNISWLVSSLDSVTDFKAGQVCKIRVEEYISNE